MQQPKGNKMKSNMMRKRAIAEVECSDCKDKGIICDKHNPQVKELDLPQKTSNPSKEYEKDKTYQDKEGSLEKEADVNDTAKQILDYVKTKRMALADLLNKRGENALAAKVVTDLQQSVPGATRLNTGMLAGVIAKYLVNLTQKSLNEKVVAPFSDSQFLQEIAPIVERKQSSLEEPQHKEELPMDKHSKLNLKLAAEGGAAEESESEEQTSVDSGIVSLLEAAKNEWTNLGDPVNPATWPKEVERAILALNESIVKAIQSTQDKLAEGDFYSKNVDEGVDSVGGGTGLDDLNIAPAEETPNNELPLEEAPVDNKALMNDKMSSKTASSEITSTETKKALKFTQDLGEKVAGIFFDYKKTVEVANNSALVKSAGEDMVRLKTKLAEVEKVLDKQLDVLTLAEDSIEDAKKQQSKKSSKECCGKCKKDEKCECTSGGKCECVKKASKSVNCEECKKPFSPNKPDHKICQQCHKSKSQKEAAFKGQPESVKNKAEEIVKELKKKPEFKGDDPDYNPWAVALSQAKKTLGKESSMKFMGLSLASEE